MRAIINVDDIERIRFNGHYYIRDGKQRATMPEIARVIFNGNATIVLWADGVKTVVHCQYGDEFDPEKGVLACIAKRVYGNSGKFNDVLDEAIEDGLDDAIERESKRIRQLMKQNDW